MDVNPEFMASLVPQINAAARAAVSELGFHLSVDDWLKIVGMAVGAIVWLVRLEGKVNAVERSHAKLEERLNHYENALNIKLSAIERSLAKIEGRLSIKEERQE